MAVDPWKWSSARCEVRARRESSSVMILRYRGESDAASVPWVASLVDKLCTVSTRPTLFVDLADLASHDAELRTRMTGVLIDACLRGGTLRVLVRPGIGTSVAKGVANVALGGFVKVFDARPAFERALESAITHTGRATESRV